MPVDHSGRGHLRSPEGSASFRQTVLPRGADGNPKVLPSQRSTSLLFLDQDAAVAGTGPYDVNATRWGDYSFAVPDPTSHSAWLATEYIPPASSQTTTGARNWGTRVIHVKLG
jgi:hypothetical protein